MGTVSRSQRTSCRISRIHLKIYSLESNGDSFQIGQCKALPITNQEGAGEKIHAKTSGIA